MGDRLKVLVLAGGPDRERAVSLVSGAAVGDALREMGHDVREADVRPSDLSALDAFGRWGGDVIFPVFHGAWGEGGGLQQVLDERGLPYVGCRAPAASLAMDKASAKALLAAHGLATPASELIAGGERPSLAPPVVVKAVAEGSSLGLAICHTLKQRDAAADELAQQYDRLLVERYVAGMELTVGLLNGAALPPIHIVPAGDYYDYEAKYERDDTQYRFDIDLPEPVLREIVRLACRAGELLGVRHLARVDFLVDAEHRPWFIEVNTMPGFTDHSLLPMAAAQAGWPMPKLVDHLVRLAAAEQTASDVAKSFHKAG